MDKELNKIIKTIDTILYVLVFTIGMNVGHLLTKHGLM